MEISTSTKTTSRSIYTKYQNLSDRAKSGTINSKSLIEQYRGVAKEGRGYGFVNVLLNFADTPPIQLTDEVARIFEEPEKNKLLIKKIYADAMKKYGTKNSRHEPKDQRLYTFEEAAAIHDGKRRLVLAPSKFSADQRDDYLKLGQQDMKEIRSQFNANASSQLRDYASKHKAQWSLAANELGISIGGWQYSHAFSQQPDDASSDISVGSPNSKAEKIFRHIASATDIKAFDTKMAPALKLMEAAVKQKVLAVIDRKAAQFKEFSPKESVLSAAGITHQDMVTESITRNRDGQYISRYDSKRGDAVASIINENQAVRAIYDAKWAAFPVNSYF